MHSISQKYSFWEVARFDPMTMLVISAATTFAGTLANAGAQQQQAAAYEQQATAEQQAAQYKATEENRQAQEQRATSQRQALAKRRETEYTQSKLQASAAASGGGADDPTIIKLASDISGQGEYGALSDMYSGETRAVGLQNQANLDIYSGSAKAAALRANADMARSRATATILGGIGGLAGGFGKAGGFG